MSFGHRLTQARKAKGLTQEALGKGLGTDGADASKSVVYGWEKDQHYPRVDQLVLICEKLGEESDWLLFGRRSSSALSPELAQLAGAVEELPTRQRDWVMMNLREAVKLARETVTESTTSESVDRTTTPSPVRRRVA